MTFAEHAAARLHPVQIRTIDQFAASPQQHPASWIARQVDLPVDVGLIVMARRQALSQEAAE